MNKTSQVLVVLWLVIAAFIAYLILGLVNSREAVEQRARDQAQSYVRLAEQHASAIFDRADGALTMAKDYLRPADLTGPLTDERRQELETLLMREQRRVAGIVAMPLVNAKGDIIAHSLGAGKYPPVNDRKHFQQLKQDSRTVLAISESVLGRVSKEWVLQIGRRIDLPDGRFGGMIGANIGLAKNFTDFYATLPLGKDSAVTLRDPEDRLLVRFPIVYEKLGKPVATSGPIHDRLLAGDTEGVIIIASAIDNIERVFAFRRLTNYPIYATVGLSMEDALAGWRREGDAAALGALLVIAAGIFVTAVLRRKARADNMLNALAIIVESSDDAILGADLNGVVTSWNAGAQRIFGFSAEEMIGKSAAAMIPPDKQGEYRALVESGRVGESVINLETVRMRKDGQRIDVALTVSSIRNTERRITGYSVIVRDITRRKQAEDALRDNEERFRDLVEMSSDWYWEQDAQFRFIAISQGSYRRTGFAEDGTLGKARWQLPICGVSDEQWRLHRTLLDRHEPFQNFVYQLRNQAGDMLWFSVSGKPLFGAKGEFLGYRGVGSDITERKRAEEAIRASEARLKRAELASKSGNWELHLESRQISASDGAAKLYGLDKGQFAYEVVKGIPLAEYRPMLDAALKNLIENNQPYDVEFKIKTVDSGEIRDIHSVAMLDNEKKILFGIIQDTTERKQAEQALAQSERRFRRLFEESGSVMLLMDPASGDIAAANRAAAAYYGYRLEQLIGMNIAQLNTLPPEEIALERQRVLHEERNYFNFSHRLASGEVRDTEVYSTPVEVGGKPLLFSIVHDITERKRAEAARTQLEAQLRESQKMEAIGTLAGGIAHDFNNILAAILGNAALAKRDMGLGQLAAAQVSLEEIAKAGGRARNLVQQILAFSRKQAQDFAIQPLRPLLEEALGLLRATLPAGVEIGITLADMPLYARADATQIGQVLMNLCTNAWQAMQGGAGRIDVSLDEAELDAAAAQRLGGLASGRYACIRVSDNGCGMDEATQARIFEPFFTTKPVDKGTGLGLAVVHGIVRAHQGAIAVESALDKGTTFRVYLPAAAAPAQATPAAKATTATEGGRGKHVLYVDDDDAMVFLVRRMLENLGYRVSGFDRGDAALAAVRGNPDDFDLVVTDFNMPGLSGLEVAAVLARIRPKLPVVITSGYITEELAAGARAAGVRQVVYKPNTVDELCATIRNLLESAGA